MLYVPDTLIILGTDNCSTVVGTALHIRDKRPALLTFFFLERHDSFALPPSLPGLSPRANFTDRAAAVCRRSL
jgi:hypothetical protein